MLTDDVSDNRVVRARLNQPPPNRLNIRFGLDPNKIKGLNNFPLYNSTAGFTSHAPPNIDAWTFHPNNKYKIKAAVHTAAPSINLPIYENLHLGAPSNTNTRVPRGTMSRFFGLPVEKDIILENSAAIEAGLAHSKTPKVDFMIRNWQAEVGSASGGLPPGIMSIIGGAPSATATSGGSAAPSRRPRGARTATATAATPPAVVNPVVVGQAFATPTPTPTAPSGADEIPTPGAPAAAPPSPPVKGPATNSDDEGGDDKEDVDVKEKKPPAYDQNAASSISSAIRQNCIDYDEGGRKDPSVLASLAARVATLGKIVKKPTTAATVTRIFTALDKIDVKIVQDFFGLKSSSSKASPPEARAKSAPRAERK